MAKRTRSHESDESHESTSNPTSMPGAAPVPPVAQVPLVPQVPPAPPVPPTEQPIELLAVSIAAGMVDPQEAERPAAGWDARAQTIATRSVQLARLVRQAARR